MAITFGNFHAVYAVHFDIVSRYVQCGYKILTY